MFLGALLDAGVALDDLERALGSLGDEGVSLAASPVERGGLRAVRVEVRVEERAGAPAARTLGEILDLLDRLGIDPRDRARAGEVFRLLARAEARVHRADETRVHFHEVGALDAVADIVGAVAGLRLLGVTTLTTGPLPLGHGIIQSEHGALPNPAPATQELLAGLAVIPVDERAELVTPTGAALVAYLAERGPAPSFRLARAGSGAGARELAGRPNILRLFLGEATAGPVLAEETVRVIRATVDDATPEVHGYAMETLIERGALDAYLTPVIMKKGRPAVEITVLAPEERWEELARLVFAETTTLGVRISREARRTLPRRIETVTTPWGEARVKVASLAGGEERAAPEYEDARALARVSGLPFREVMERILALHREKPRTGS